MENKKISTTKIKNILNDANIKCDDNINANTLLIYLNQGITKLNMELRLKLPTIFMEDIGDNSYEVSDTPFVIDAISLLLMNFVAYSIKQTEGYQDNENTFYREYLSLKMNFQQTFVQLIKDEYKLTDREDGAVQFSKTKPNKLLTFRRLY